MRTESLLLNVIINRTQQCFFHWSCFLGISKLWLKQKIVVILFSCLSALLSRIKGISGLLSPYLPAYLPPYCNFYTQHSSFSVTHISHLCAKIPLRPGSHCLVIDCHALFIAPKDREEPASQPGWNQVHFSLFEGSHSGRYQHGLLKHRLCYPQQRETLYFCGHSSPTVQL